MSNEVRLCDGDCNYCPIVNHPNNRMVTKILNELHDKFGNDVYRIVQGHCPNLTVCYDCHIDDFCHIEGCEIISQADIELTKMHEVAAQIDADLVKLREGVQ